MSKKKVLLFMSLILVIAVSIAIILSKQSYYYINQVNKNLDAGEIKLLAKGENLKDVLEQQFIEHPGFGGSFYSNEKEGINIVFSGFPDVTTPDYSLTRIEIKSARFSIYDIHVGDNINKADLLKEKGFRKLINENKYQLSYKKGKIIIDFQLNEKSEITKINIDLQSTNKHNVVF